MKSSILNPNLKNFKIKKRLIAGTFVQDTGVRIFVNEAVNELNQHESRCNCLRVMFDILPPTSSSNLLQ